jgi:hypothetical protein
MTTFSKSFIHRHTAQRWALSLCSALVALAVALGVVLPFLPVPYTRSAAAAPLAATSLGWEHKGFSLPVWDENGLNNSGPALEQLASTGANSVTFVITWYQPSITATDMNRTGGTASDASLIWAMQKANSLGLKVILKPHVDSQDGLWRAYINPQDPSSWFANYRSKIIYHYADLGKTYGASGLVIGAELITMATTPAYDSQWRSLIAGVRQRFSGKLTYSANWGSGDFAEEFTRVPFWDALDYIGISAYFPLADTTTPTVSGMVSRWNSWRTLKIEPVQQRWGKPVLFIEGGYRSADGTAKEPFNSWDVWPLDTQEQVDCWEALFQAWADVPWFAGGAFWAWNLNTNISPTDIWYEVQNKPALNTIKTGFGGQAGPTPTPQAPTITIYSPTSSQSVSGTVTVKAFATNAASVAYRVDGGTEVALTFNSASGLWEGSLDTTTLTNGAHNVEVVNHGKNGTIVRDTAWNVQVNNGSTAPSSTPSRTSTPTPTPTPVTSGAPSITIKSPLSNQTYSGTIQVQAEGTNLQSASYRVDAGAAVPMTRDTNLNIWFASLNTATLANGSHNVDVTGVGNAGTTATDRAWNVQVNNGAVTPVPGSTATVSPSTPGPPSGGPSAPSNLTANRIGSTNNQRIDLTWTNSSPAATLRLQRSTSSSFSADVVSIDLPAGTTSYRDEAVTSSTTYYYRVYAITGGQVSSPSNTASVTTR